MIYPGATARVGPVRGGVRAARREPQAGDGVVARIRRVRHDLELPMKDDYSAFRRRLVADAMEGVRG